MATRYVNYVHGGMRIDLNTPTPTPAPQRQSEQQQVIFENVYQSSSLPIAATAATAPKRGRPSNKAGPSHQPPPLQVQPSHQPPPLQVQPHQPGQSHQPPPSQVQPSQPPQSQPGQSQPTQPQPGPSTIFTQPSHHHPEPIPEKPKTNSRALTEEQKILLVSLANKNASSYRFGRFAHFWKSLAEQFRQAPGGRQYSASRCRSGVLEWNNKRILAVKQAEESGRPYRSSELHEELEHFQEVIDSQPAMDMARKDEGGEEAAAKIEKIQRRKEERHAELREIHAKRLEDQRKRPYDPTTTDGVIRIISDESESGLEDQLEHFRSKRPRTHLRLSRHRSSKRSPRVSRKIERFLSLLEDSEPPLEVSSVSDHSEERRIEDRSLQLQIDDIKANIEARFNRQEMMLAKILALLQPTPATRPSSDTQPDASMSQEVQATFNPPYGEWEGIDAARETANF